MDMFLLQLNRWWTRKKILKTGSKYGTGSIKCSSPRQTVLVSNSCLLCQVNVPPAQEIHMLSLNSLPGKKVRVCVCVMVLFSGIKSYYDL